VLDLLRSLGSAIDREIVAEPQPTDTQPQAELILGTDIGR
jgi:hypothetical protein